MTRVSTLCVAITIICGFSACDSPHAAVTSPRDRDLLSRAFISFNTANSLSQPPAGVTRFTLPPAVEDSIRSLIRSGLAAGDSVSDSYLDWLNPDMKRYFRSYYLRGQRTYLAGNIAGDTVKQAEGIRLITAWHDQFWGSRGADITDKALAP